jgi:hypothetical protein
VLGKQECTVEVHRHGATPVVQRQRRERRQRKVVDCAGNENIQAPEFLTRTRDRRLGGRFLGDVGAQRGEAVLRRRQRGRGPGKRRGVDIDRDHAGALAHEMPADAAADAAARTGDDRYFPLQTFHPASRAPVAAASYASQARARAAMTITSHTGCTLP